MRLEIGWGNAEQRTKVQRGSLSGRCRVLPGMLLTILQWGTLAFIHVCRKARTGGTKAITMVQDSTRGPPKLRVAVGPRAALPNNGVSKRRRRTTAEGADWETGHCSPVPYCRRSSRGRRALRCASSSELVFSSDCGGRTERSNTRMIQQNSSPVLRSQSVRPQ